MKTNMHYGASPAIFIAAQNLRSHLTEAEKILWEYLKNHKSGFRFRRQHPMWNYVVDFYCHRLKLVIEADGEIHLTKENQIRDEEKNEGLKNLGLQVLRFTNFEILHNREKVFLEIDTIVNDLVQKKLQHRNRKHEPGDY